MNADTASPSTSGVPARRLVCLLVPNFNMMTLNALLEPARIACYLAQSPLYTVSYHAFDGDVLRASNGMTIPCTEPPERLSSTDTLFLIGSWGSEHYANQRLNSWLRLQVRLGVKLCSLEMGSYILARAGLLAGRQVTAHWSYLAGFQEMFPATLASEQLFVEDGQITTSAGGTASIDLMLDIVRRDFGELMSQDIAAQMMHHQIRPGATPQRKTPGRGVDDLPLPVRTAIEIVDGAIGEPMSVPQIASRVGLSQRQLERQFRAAIGCTVVQFSLMRRLQHARVLLISTELGVLEIATASGFNSLSHFAFAFRKCFGKRPSDYRADWPEHDTAPHWPGTLARYLDALETPAGPVTRMPG